MYMYLPRNQAIATERGKERELEVVGYFSCTMTCIGVNCNLSPFGRTVLILSLVPLSLFSVAIVLTSLVLSTSPQITE